SGFHFFFHIVAGIKHQQGVFELLDSQWRQLRVVEQVNQRLYVVTAEHHTQQLDSQGLVDQGRGGFAFENGTEEGGFYVGGFVNAWGNAVGDQVEQSFLFVGGRVF